MKLSSYPPLSGTTVIDGDEVDVIVCIDLEDLEVKGLSSSRSGIVCAVWHDNGTEDGWREDVMVPGLEDKELSVFSTVSSPSLYFKHTLYRPTSGQPISFTINYLYPGDPTKKWVNFEYQTRDGIIIFRPEIPIPDMNNNFLIGMPDHRAIEKYFTIPPPSDDSVNPVTIEQLHKSMGNTAATDPRTWVYTFSIPTSRTSRDPGYAEAALAIPVQGTTISYFATIKHGTAWVQPHHSSFRGLRDYEGFHPPREAVMAAFMTYQGDVVLFLPLSNGEKTVYLKGSQNAKEDVVIGVGRNDGFSKVDGKVVVVVAKNVEEAVEEAFYWAKRIGEDGRIMDIEEEAEQGGGDDPWSDSLKYCTWNSLGRELTDKRIVNAVNDLYDSKIEVQTVIIDDNWQSLDNNGRDSFGHRWTDFEADKIAFPRGLKGLVEDIKRSNRGVKHVAVWHGILGYWNGISPNGWISRNYKLRNVGNGSIYVVDKSDIGRFYDDFYKFLSNQGITAVKADTQCLLDERLPSADKGELFPAYLSAWRNAASKYFGTRAISCMSLVPQILFTNHLSPSLPKFTLRNSDDFFPHTPNSHPWHIFANAHNAVLTARLNVTPDWDMFQTRHEWAGYHAAARCISGGPVYITDDVGSHDTSIVKKVTARSKTGAMVTLRPNGKARSSEFFVGFGEKRPLRVTNTASISGYDIKLLGTFDLDGGRERTDMIPIKEIIGDEVITTLGGETQVVKEFGVFSHHTRKVQVVKSSGYVKMNVVKGGWDVVAVCPIVPVRIDGGREEVSVGVFGLLEQISGAAGMSEVKIAGGNSTIRVGAELKALGIFGIYANYSDPSRYGKIRQVTIGGQDVPERFWTIGRGKQYGEITVDVQSAWDYLRLDDRWDLWVWVHLAV
ncbi:hypothetical protein TWF191_002459 [Orbilia oligospora]|uniref:Uncharacterized protein n=2 Tax=Orbilia oligospora TaxID=2813651 RepID=A0A7C8VAE6_ORBOL|nr:hypothetical protein TWF191_002459 [Orbilia oligospora]